jgi:DNA modification methylase
MKPVELMERLVQNSSVGGELVFDPFLGSGTTLIACERLGRRCRGVEIAPGYVAVTLQRFLDATGKTPELLSNG